MRHRPALWYKLDDTEVTLVGEQLVLDKVRKAAKPASASTSAAVTGADDVDAPASTVPGVPEPAHRISCVLAPPARPSSRPQRALTLWRACNVGRSTEAYLLVYVDERELAIWDRTWIEPPGELATILQDEDARAFEAARELQAKYGPHCVRVAYATC